MDAWPDRTRTATLAGRPSPACCLEEDLDTAEGLRRLLERLHHAGPAGWQEEDVRTLVGICTRRYGALARKYGQDPSDAAAAAFEVLRHRSTRTARDPWAVVTTGVRITLIAEWRAAALLTSPSRARRREVSQLPTVERFCDRPQGWMPDQSEHVVPDRADPGRARMARLLAETVQLLSARGWPADATAPAVAYICDRLTDLGSRPAAYEALRRDKAARAAIDLSHDRWIGLLRLTLGHASLPGPARHGLLARLLAGDHPDYLLTAIDVAATAPLAPTEQEAPDA